VRISEKGSVPKLPRNASHPATALGMSMDSTPDGVDVLDALRFQIFDGEPLGVQPLQFNP
jgi:hypothetical protein